MKRLAELKKYPYHKPIIAHLNETSTLNRGLERQTGRLHTCTYPPDTKSINYSSLFKIIIF